MIGASNVINAIDSIVGLMTPTVTITSNTVSGSNWELTMCRTYWMTPGMTISIGGADFKIISFVLNTSIIVSGTAQPSGSTFTLSAPEFWHGYRRKVNAERNKQLSVKEPFVYLPVPTVREDNSYDTDIAYFGSIRPIFLMGYDQKLDTIGLQQTNVIDPLNEMADYFIEIIEDNGGLYNTPEDISRKEWMNFGNETVWGNDSAIFDQPLSGIEMDFTLEVLFDGLCDCDDIPNSVACADVTTDLNGTPTNVDTAAGQNISIEVVQQSDGSPVGTLTTNTANTKRIEVVVSTCADATVENSDLSYSNTVASGGTLVLPDVTNTDTDGSPVVTPAQTPFVCSTPDPSGVDLNATPLTDVQSGNTKAMTITYANGDPLTITTVTNTETVFSGTVPDSETPLNTANLFKTGMTTSARTGDDGDLKVGRGVDWFHCGYTNPFYGGTARFRGNTGGYTDGTNYYDVNDNATTYALAFPDDECMDWAYYDQVNGTVPMWYLLSMGNNTPVPALPRGGQVGGKSIYNAIDEALASTQNGYTDWYCPNAMEVISLIYWEQNPNSGESLNYKPFEFYRDSGSSVTGSNFRVVTGTTNTSRGVYLITENGIVANVAPTNTVYTYFIKRTATLVNLGL